MNIKADSSPDPSDTVLKQPLGFVFFFFTSEQDCVQVF